MNRPISPPIAPALAIVAALGLLFLGALYGVWALAEAALPIVDRILNWGG